MLFCKSALLPALLAQISFMGDGGRPEAEDHRTFAAPETLDFSPGRSRVLQLE